MPEKGESDFLVQSLPFWQSLAEKGRSKVLDNTVFRSFNRGVLSRNNSRECAGLFLIKSGQLRAFINSDDGREISLYRLLPLDICIMSASCMLKNLSFEINLFAEKKTELFIIPTPVFERLSAENSAGSDKFRRRYCSG